MTSRSYQRSLGHELWLAGLGWQRAVRRALRPLELTPTQFLVLDVCANTWNRERDHLGPNQNQIAELTGLDRQTIQRVVVALEERGFMSRGPSHDRYESWCVDLRPRGERALAEAHPAVKKATKKYLEACDRRTLKTALATLDP